MITHTTPNMIFPIDPNKQEVEKLAICIAALLRSLPPIYGLEAGRSMLSGLTSVYADFLTPTEAIPQDHQSSSQAPSRAGLRLVRDDLPQSA